MAGPDRISTCRIAEAAAGRDRAAGTFGVGENDGHQSGAPVGDPDGEIPHPELVHAGAGGLRAQQGRRDAQRREEQLAAPRPSHGRPIDARLQLLAEAEPQLAIAQYIETGTRAPVRDALAWSGIPDGFESVFVFSIQIFDILV